MANPTKSKNAKAEQYVAIAGSSASTTRRQSIRGRKGNLKDMPQMPFDILFEIFSHMKPRDLLSLSRTSKPFRQLLMSRTSVLLWKTSRKNVPGLPDCPSFLSEPAYANLCFVSHCHHCLELHSNGKKIFWEVGARYCSPCKLEFFHVSRCHARGDLESFNKGREEKIPDEIIESIIGENTTSLGRHKPTIEAFKERWPELIHVEQRAQAIAELRAQKDDRAKFAQACIAWSLQRKNARKEELKILREDRKKATCDRLKELGYGEDLEFSNGFYDDNSHPLWNISNIIQPKPWTDGTWKTKEPVILQAMNTIRRERLFAMRKAAIESRVKLLEEVLKTSVGGKSPYTYGFLFLPEVKSLIDVPPTEDVSVSVTRKDLEKLEPVFDRYYEELKQEGLATIAKLVSNALSLPLSIDPCALAVSQFVICSRCSRSISQSDVLAHCCVPGPFQYSYDKHGDIYEGVITHLVYGSTRPKLDYLTYADDLEHIIMACGEDYTTVTPEEMDSLPVQLTCAVCPPDGFLNLFDWKQAFEHSQGPVHKFHSAPAKHLSCPVWQQPKWTYS
ncbi:hypothetical protein QCA50_016887 [Cerrena zonata]|uniref:F-box domain-containing protein n=1 Tax=Cerrena zonata TaxID=2478898 RepID=A0AAW0FH76_9APHY